MRIYLSADLAEVETLAAGDAVSAPPFIPVSEDEDDEYAAYDEAAAAGRAVIAAEVDTAEQPVALDRVASFHVAIDNSGDLAWFATQEIDAVLLALRNTAPEA